MVAPTRSLGARPGVGDDLSHRARAQRICRNCNAWLQLSLCSLVLWVCLPTEAVAEDWSQFLGPARDGTYAGPALLRQWPREGPTKLWSVTTGGGFSGPVSSADRVILFHRMGDVERVECLSLTNGKSLWKADHPTQYRDDFGFDNGPRATPAIGGGRVFVMGAEGTVRGLNLSSGEQLWVVRTKDNFRAPKGFFGMACSPLLIGNRVILAIGGQDGSGIIALNAQTGAVIWKSLNDEASYASPTLARDGQKEWVVLLGRSGLTTLDVVTGEVSDTFPWRSRSHASVNAATPLVRAGEIFISASYETGAALVRLSHGKLSKKWSADGVLSNHYATSVERGGFLYGFDGRQEESPTLACVEWRTGQVRWRKSGLGAGTLIQAGDALLISNERGDLIEARATPEAFVENRRAQILPTGVRAHVALSSGLLIARGRDRLVCLDLR